MAFALVDWYIYLEEGAQTSNFYRINLRSILDLGCSRGPRTEIYPILTMFMINLELFELRCTMTLCPG